MQTRRIFLLKSVGAAAALPLASQAFAQQAAAKLDPKDPQAAALGYVEDHTKTDTKKFPRYTKDQQCVNCQLYTAKAGTKEGPCTLFQNRLVTAQGWCSAWVKKAG
jgi:hypothetical protein